MAIPKNREDFKEYCLRKLGKPVILINVDDAQVDDRVDDALQMFYEYHFDGKETSYIAHTITQDDIDNGYFTLPDSVFGITDVARPTVSGNSAGSGIFNVQYQLMLSDYIGSTGIFSFSGEMTDFYLVKRHLNLMDFMLNGPALFDYNRKTNKLTLRGSSPLVVGEVIVFKAYTMFEKDTNGEVTVENIWNDEWVKKYAVELIRQQWGQNISKFAGIQMPGGVTLNGLEMYDKATTAIEKLEDELKNLLQEPADFFVG